MTAEALTFQTTPIITFGYVMQVLFSLGLVIIFIYLTAKYVLPRLKVNNTGRFIQILDRIYMEPQVSAYILKVKKSSWLVVVSNKQVARIDKLEDTWDE